MLGYHKFKGRGTGKEGKGKEKKGKRKRKEEYVNNTDAMDESQEHNH